MEINIRIAFLSLVALAAISCSKSQSEEVNKTLLFEDEGSGDWREKWFLDGLQATIKNDESGMDFKAGKVWKNDSSHAVLWTKEEFQDNILIEYDFTRTDSAGRGVIIIYFHATGKGDKEYPEDVFEWHDKRTVPTMSTYFRNMNAYHISYSTNSDVYDDYIRLRRYEHQYRLKGTEILPDNFNTGFFEYGVSYHIEISRYDDQITMSVSNNFNPDKSQTFKWDASSKPLLSSGRIGLRHMYTRGGRYKNFKVWSLE